MNKKEQFHLHLDPLINQMIAAAHQYDIPVLVSLDVAEKDAPDHNLMTMVTPSRDGSVPRQMFDALAILTEGGGPTRGVILDKEGIPTDTELTAEEATALFKRITGR